MNSFIETLNQYGESFLSFAWPMLWQSSLLIAALFAFDLRLRRRLRASIRYALWLVVLVKLCVPPTLALPTSPAWWLHKAPPPAVAKPLPHYTVTYDNGPLPEIPQTSLAAVVPPKPVMTNAAWLLAASVVISSVLLLWLLVRWWQITRLVRRAAASERLTAIADNAQQFIGLNSKVRVMLTTNSMSPAVCGLFRPVILIPQSLAENFSDEQMRAVLLHELIHLRRRDVWVNFVQALLQIVYWWHPLVWLANARIRRVREEAVDDAVMLTLRDEAEAYAPTLLEVAKLALNRPLASLGLVGILESRHSLRQRIERLVDFRPPRKAGLTLVSLLGILAFTAVAVPMGQRPAPSGDATDLQSLTVKVNPEIFLRNVKAQALNYMHTTNDDWVPILIDILRAEGVDDVPPHTFEFKIKAGEMTAKNSPDALEIFRQILEQLNREDGKGRPFVPNSSYHRSFHPTSVLIKAQFYAMRTADYRKLIGYVDNVSFDPGNYQVAPIAAERFAEFGQKIKSLGLNPFSSPQVQTGHGILAEFYTGVGTNGVHFDCQPYISAKGIEIAFRAEVIGNLSADGTTLVGTANHTFNGRVLAQDHDGIIVCANDYDGSVKNNLVVVLEVQIVTNAAPVKANARTIEKINAAGQLVQDAKLDYEMGKWDEAEVKLKWALALDPENAGAKYYLGLVQTTRLYLNQNEFKSARKNIVEKLYRIRLDRVVFEAVPLGEVVRILHEQSKILDPDHRGINFLLNPNPGQNVAPTIDPATGLPMATAADNDSGLISIPITIRPPLTNLSLGDVLDALVKAAPEPIRYSVQDYAIVISPYKPSVQLYSRHFRVDANTFMGALHINTGMQTNDITAMAKDFFKTLGVNLDMPGKSIFFNDGLSELFVRATAQDLDTIENTLEVFNRALPQIHIKARFIEVPKGTLAGLDNVIAVTNPPARSNQVAGFVGILTDKNFRTVLHNLEARPGVETLAEPEVVTTSGRQTQMRATAVVVTIITNSVFEEYPTNQNGSVGSVTVKTGPLETGPIFDVVSKVLADGYTLDLQMTASSMEFYGYADIPTNMPPLTVTTSTGETVGLPREWPAVLRYQKSTHVNLFDNQTVILSLTNPEQVRFGEPDDKREAAVAKHIRDAARHNGGRNDILVFVTATIVDPAGNRVHADDELPFAKDAIPSQPK